MIEPKFQDHFVAANAIPHKTDPFPELRSIVTLPNQTLTQGMVTQREAAGGAAAHPKRTGRKTAALFDKLCRLFRF